MAVSGQQSVALRFLRDACAYAMGDDLGPDEAARIVGAACRTALECGLELPGLVPPQASPPAVVLGAAGGEPDPARLATPLRDGSAQPKRRLARSAGRLLHR